MLRSPEPNCECADLRASELKSHETLGLILSPCNTELIVTRVNNCTRDTFCTLRDTLMVTVTQSVRDRGEDVTKSIYRVERTRGCRKASQVWDGEKKKASQCAASKVA